MVVAASRAVAARRARSRLTRGDVRPHLEDHPFLVLDVPIAVIMRKAFSDAEAIAAVTS